MKSIIVVLDRFALNTVEVCIPCCSSWTITAETEEREGEGERNMRFPFYDSALTLEPAQFRLLCFFFWFSSHLFDSSPLLPICLVFLYETRATQALSSSGRSELLSSVH